MASNESIFDKLNLSSGERRLVMAVLVVLMLALAWMVWGMIPSPGVTQNKISQAQQRLNSFTNEISKIADYEKKIGELQGLGSAVIKIEQQTDMRKFINQLTAANGVDIDSTTSADPKTGDFFIEQSMNIRFSSKERELVNFLWKLGSSDSMVRVSQMRVQPDKNRYKLSGTMTLTASYQKDVKATKPKPSLAKPKAETKPEPAKSKSETKPAKKSGTRRSVPSRRVRTIDQ